MEERWAELIWSEVWKEEAYFEPFCRPSIYLLDEEEEEEEGAMRRRSRKKGVMKRRRGEEEECTLN